MPSWMLQSAPYKGLFILIVVFVALEYIFNTVTETRNAIFNATRSYQVIEDKPSLNYAPVVAATTPQLHLKTANFTIDLSNLNYIVTVPPALVGTNISTTYMPTPINNNNNGKEREEEFWGESSRGVENGTEKPPCADVSQSLYGRVPIRKYPIPTINTLEKRFGWLQPGGHWAPPNCTVDKKVALVVPFRDRGAHLLLFLQHMHPFLRKQRLDYTIFVVEQEGKGPFNRAMLMNVGYTEALKSGKFDCFIFHDVDLLPEDDRNLYGCPEQPRHMSVAVDLFKYRLPYPAIFGGVSAINTRHFKLLNGFSNSFWGWGGEDDDMSNRIRYRHLYITRYPITIARYTMLSHKKDPPNPSRYDILKKGQKLFDKDGLSSLKYGLLMKKQKLLYTWILARLSNHTSDQHRFSVNANKFARRAVIVYT